MLGPLFSFHREIVFFRNRPGEWKCSNSYQMRAHRESNARQECNFVIPQQVNEQIPHIFGREALPANPDHRRRCRILDGEKGVKIRIERHDNTAFSSCFVEDDMVRGGRQADFSDVNRVDPSIPQQLRSAARQAFVQKDSHVQ